jgi:hypothetical protein
VRSRNNGRTTPGQRWLRQGQNFLLRVRRNITLPTGLRSFQEQRDGLVYLWPQEHRHYKPLVLRRIVLRHGQDYVFVLKVDGVACVPAFPRDTSRIEGGPGPGPEGTFDVLPVLGMGLELYVSL